MEGLSAEEILMQHEDDCDGALEAFKRDLSRVRTGRASTGLLEGIQVEYYGARTALTHLAQLSTPEANLILVQVYDQGAAAAVERAIIESGLGFNPSRDGNVLRVFVPPLSEERRREIVKHLHRMAEEIKVSVRNHRRDANDNIKDLEKNGEVNKDDAKKFLDKIQKQTDSRIAETDILLKEKEEECMAV